MNINRKRALVGLAGVAFFGSVVASAASLGGLTSTDLGANDTVVASCDTDGITIDYTTAYTAASGSGRYTVSSVTLGGIAAGCDTQSVDVVLRGAAGASLGTATGTADATGSVTLAVTGAPAAELVIGSAVVISG